MTHSDGLRPGTASHFFYELSEGARRQGNVIFALIFRELKLRTSDGYGYLSLLGIIAEPAIGVVAVSIFWYIMRRQEVMGIHIILFLTVSITAFTIVRRSLSSVPKTVRSARSFYAFPKVKPFDAIMARFIIELVLTLFGGAIVLVAIWWFMDLEMPAQHLLESMGVFGLLIMMGLGLSLLLGIYGTIYPIVGTLLSVTSRGLIFVSAVMHPASQLPPAAQVVIAWNPIAHGMELLRYYALGIPYYGHMSVYYLSAVCTSLLTLGFLAYYANRFRVLER